MSESFVPFGRMLGVRGGTRARDRLLRWGLAGAGRARTYWYRATPNFGDLIAPELLAWVLGRPPVWVPREAQGKVLALGSILHEVRPTDQVWGTGAIEDRPLRPPEGVRFHAVRGPLTRALVEADVPAVFGDPALLLPRFHQPAVDRRYRVGVVPHYVDRAFVQLNDSAITVIDVQRPWREVVARICSCEVIVSSSLHGVIVAESYGIPACWVTFGDRVRGGNLKFNDHLLGTGRADSVPTPWAHGIDAALARALPPMSFDDGPLLAAASAIHD